MIVYQNNTLLMIYYIRAKMIFHFQNITLCLSTSQAF